MKNILATQSLRGRMDAVNWTAVTLGLSLVGSALWGVWATDKLLALDKRDLLLQLRSADRGDIATRSATNDNKVELRVLCHDYLSWP